MTLERLIKKGEGAVLGKWDVLWQENTKNNKKQETKTRKLQRTKKIQHGSKVSHVKFFLAECISRKTPLSSKFCKHEETNLESQRIFIMNPET